MLRFFRGSGTASRVPFLFDHRWKVHVAVGRVRCLYCGFFLLIALSIATICSRWDVIFFLEPHHKPLDVQSLHANADL